MYSKYETLKKMDSVIISKIEFDNVIVWNERLNKNLCNPDDPFKKNMPRLRKLNPKNPAKPPAAKTEDEDGKNLGNWWSNK